MQPVDISKTGVVALLDEMSPPRLGTLLRGARRQRSLTRRYVASHIGRTASELRRCERGATPAQPGVVAALAANYGGEIVAQFVPRIPIRLEPRRIVVGPEEAALASNDADEVLGAYAGIVAKLRCAKLGDSLGLRADDLALLSTALGEERLHVETRIVELLDCTLREARSLHSEMLHHKFMVPVAGLVTGLAVVAGVGCSSAAPGASHDGTTPHKRALVSTTTAASTVPAEEPSTTTTMKVAVVKPQVVAAQGAFVTTTTAAVQIGTAETEVAPVTAARNVPVVKASRGAPKPVSTEDTTPVSYLPNGPITIIQK